MAKQKPHRSVVITAVIVIGALMAWALYLGFNGTLLTGVVALLAGLAGWVSPPLKLRKH